MTLGEKRVRTDFNVSGDAKIDEIKNKTAELINMCIGMHGSEGGEYEQERLYSLAQTAYEEAAMWAVKAITYK